MKRNAAKNRSTACFAVVMMTLSALSFSSPASAASKSASFQVSATILPTMEIGRSANAKKGWESRTNLGKHEFQMNESLVRRGEQKVRLFSLTAL